MRTFNFTLLGVLSCIAMVGAIPIGDDACAGNIARRQFRFSGSMSLPSGFALPSSYNQTFSTSDPSQSFPQFSSTNFPLPSSSASPGVDPSQSSSPLPSTSSPLPQASGDTSGR